MIFIDKTEVSRQIENGDKGRYYGFFVMTYNLLESQIQPLLDKAYKWAWIKHDKDKSPDHLHIIVCFKQYKSETMIKKLVQGEENTFCEVLKNKYKAYEYLTHENEDETKAPYEESEIHCNDTSFFQKGLGKSIDNEEFYFDLLDKNMTFRAKLTKYGRDYARYYKTYEKLAVLLRREKALEDKVENGELIPLSDENIKYYVRSETGEVINLLE